jgi:23S rRNA (cytidine1920-2'-O)/16S rRNA (cytidine1409-2'-O)-methyltransferase
VRRRLDTELVRRGLAISRERARALVEGGAVLVGGSLAEKPARLVSESEPVVVLDMASRRFVSRGGEKLDAALDRFDVVVSGRRCLDAGASTGGFTDCLLRRGASAVVAVDVGHGQLDASLRQDPRVEVLERTNLRTLEPVAVGGTPFALLVADLSFISLVTAPTSWSS